MNSSAADLTTRDSTHTLMPLCCRHFVTGSNDSTAVVWEFETLLPVSAHYNFDLSPFAVAFSSDLSILAIGGDDPTIKLNDTWSGAAIACNSV